MITFRKLVTLVVPSSILGLSWFWWRWRNKEIESSDTSMTTAEEIINVVDIDYEENAESNSEFSGSVGSDDDNMERESSDEHEHISDSISSDTDEKLLEVDEDELTVLCVGEVESDILPDFESLESDEVSPLLGCDPLSVNCDQGHLDCDSETSPTGLRRLRQQSSCGDSAICDDYSSDASLSVAGSDVKSSEGELSTPVKRAPTKECVDSSTHREWYGDAMTAVPGKERLDKPRHWGSVPVSDTDSDSECIFKRTAKIGSVPLDKLSIQLTDELSAVQMQRESQSARQRRPRQNRRRDRGKPDAPKTPKKQPPPKKQPTPKKNESSRKQRRKSNNLCCPKKDEKTWRKLDVEDLLNTKDEAPTGIRETIEYEFPDDMCGRLIGKAGRHIAEFKESTGVDICIECELRGSNRIVSITGMTSQINKAAWLLNEKFHDNLKLVEYPDMDEIKNNFSPILLEEDEYDVIVTAVVDVGNFYVQVYHQDVDEKLTNLQIDLCGIYVTPRLKYIYNNELPKVGDYCVSFVDNTWCRLKIVEVMAENRMVDAYYVDYGGNVSLSLERIWKIRPDMLQLKPQAVLCSLHDVFPYEGDEFSPEASDAFLQLINGNVLKAQIATITDDVPALRLSIYCEGGQVVSVSEQLHIWGLVDDQGIDLYADSHEENSSGNDEGYLAEDLYDDDGDATLTSSRFEDDDDMSLILNNLHSASPFVCAS